MIDRTTIANIYCANQKEQDMILDIFEMLSMKWRSETQPRKYRSRTRPPMYYNLDGDTRFGCGVEEEYDTTINASELRNQWISLKITHGGIND